MHNTLPEVKSYSYQRNYKYNSCVLNWKVVFIFFGRRKPYLVTCKLTISYKSVVLRITFFREWCSIYILATKENGNFCCYNCENNIIIGIVCEVFAVEFTIYKHSVVEVTHNNWWNAWNLYIKNIHQFSINLFTIVLTVKSACMWVVFVSKYLQYHTHSTPQKNPRCK
jgi:hypothetical protein